MDDGGIISARACANVAGLVRSNYIRLWLLILVGDCDEHFDTPYWEREQIISPFCFPFFVWSGLLGE